MRLGDRLKQPGSEGAASPATETTPEVKRRDSFELKVKVHRILIERLDLSKLISVEREKLEGEFRQEVAKILQELRPGANGGEEGKIVDEILDEIFGLGPIEPLLNAPAVEEIMVNGAKQVYVARHGKIVLTDTIFKDNDHLLKIIERIVSRVGRRVDESSPMVDARLLDGSRVNAVIPPLALKGPSLTIRLFPKKRLEVEDLLSLRTLSEPMVELLKGCVNARLNLLVSGGTGSGKTTLLNVLSRFIPADERIVTIEDSAELQLQQEHVITLESRPPNVEGQGAVTTRDLVRNCLRMRPDRIVVGEVRGGGGGETLDMLQAMNTGHDGSISTVHANTPRDALSRLEVMVAMAGLDVPLKALRQQITSAIDVVIQIARLNDGSRKITAITELTGMEGEMVTMQDIFLFQQEGMTPEGAVRGRHLPTGIRPKFLERFRAHGINIREGFFEVPIGPEGS